MEITRNNHYVPQWYQKGFLSNSSNMLHYLDLHPTTQALDNGKIITHNAYKSNPISKSFCEKDLYTTFFGSYINDEIEQKLYGHIDNIGANAVRAFISNNPEEWHQYFLTFFEYLDAQKLRTPKGLDWIRNHYPKLDQNELMKEMQAIRIMHSTIWTEAVREVVSAENSSIKFILSDHPITIYNHACSPTNEYCIYPHDPSIALIGSQTIFPLDINHCLILTNYEYATNPYTTIATEKRTNAKYFRRSMAKTDAFIRSRFFNDQDVTKINFILKARARKHIAASEKEWLFPEKTVDLSWEQLKEFLLPPENGLWQFGGKIYASYKDGTTYYQDAFGRTAPENNFLKKNIKEKELRPNENCGCGSGKKYKKCCKNKTSFERSSWKELSIRERNIIFHHGICDILGISNNKTWDDVRKELSDTQVKEIHQLYADLWPRDTDIISLLPKPDKNFRALYTGIIDSRIIDIFPTSLSLYFDEIIMQNPFIHPAWFKQDSSPIHNPHQHKSQTLENVLLFLTLFPYIETGYINLIPDPCFFDGHLQKQMIQMAKERNKDQNLQAKDYEISMMLQKNNLERMLYMLPRDQQKIQIYKTMPMLSDQEVEEILESLHTMKLKDPSALLQDDIHSEKGGQFIMIHLAPNFEISLFLSQITGSILLTHSDSRWKEITDSQYKENSISTYAWQGLTDYIDNLQHSVNLNCEATFDLRNSGKLGRIRKILKKIYFLIQEENSITNSHLIKKLINEYSDAYQLDMKEIKFDKQYEAKSKFQFLIPRGGIVHNNVQRLLISSSNQTYLKNLPMAMFVEGI